jgi:hypothetical protein
MPTLGDPDFLGAMIVKGLVQKAIVSPYSGTVLDMRNAVVIDGSDHGHGMHVMTGEEFDVVEDQFFDRYPRDEFDVYDGRDIFRK